MKRFLLALPILVLLPLISDGQSQTAKYSFDFGFTSIDPSASPGKDLYVFDSSFSSAARFGFTKTLSPWWDLGAGFSMGYRRYYSHNESITERGFNPMFDLRLLLKFANGKWIGEDALFQPYLGMGYNWNSVKLKNGNWNSYLANEWIGGVKWGLSSQIFLRTELSIDNRITGGYDPALRYRVNIGYTPGTMSKSAHRELVSVQMNSSKLLTENQKLKDSLNQVVESFRTKLDSINNLPPKVVEVEKIVYVDSSSTSEIEKDVPSDDQPVLSSEPPKGFYVVTASTKNQTKAEQMAVDLRKKYPGTYVLPSDKGYNRVAVYSGLNRQNATQLMKELRSNGYLMAWLLFED